MSESYEDGLSPENQDFTTWMVRTIRLGFVKELLAGNDTCCFTTEQYREKYEAGWLGPDGKRTPRPMHVSVVPDWPERHLRSLADVIQEVRPGVWARKETTP